MALTNSERQARYRAKRRAGRNDEFQLNTWISIEAFIALSRLARHRGETKRAALEQLILQADKEVLDSLDDQEYEHYLTVTE